MHSFEKLTKYVKQNEDISSGLLAGLTLTAALFIGGSIGTFLEGAALDLVGWDGVCLLGIIMTVCSLIISITRKY